MSTEPSCPKCGEKDWIRRDPYGRLYTNGYAICGHCATTIPRSNANVPDPEAGK